MRRVVLHAAVAAALLLVAPGFAQGFELFALPGNQFTMTTGRLQFTTPIGLVTCPLRLRGNLEPGPIEIVNGSALGEVNEAIFGTCAGGAVRPLFALGGGTWPILFKNVQGTLPSELVGLVATIEDVQVVYTGLLTCLYVGDLTINIALSGEDPYPVGAIQIQPGTPFAYVSGSFLCPSETTARAAFELTPATEYLVV